MGIYIGTKNMEGSILRKQFHGMKKRLRQETLMLWSESAIYYRIRKKPLSGIKKEEKPGTSTQRTDLKNWKRREKKIQWEKG